MYTTATSMELIQEVTLLKFIADIADKDSDLWQSR